MPWKFRDPTGIPRLFDLLTEFDLPRWVRNEFRDLNDLGLSTQVEGWLQLISIRV